MNNKGRKIENYVANCDKQVVVPMTGEGLDTECYYRYLCEISQVAELPDGKLGQTKALLLDGYSESSEGGRWQMTFAQTFRRQRDFIERLLAFIEGNYNEDVCDLVQLQFDFMLITLQAQKRFLDTITFWVPYRALMGTKGGDEYADAQQERELLLDKVNAAIRKYNF